ncbi:PREDICTED: OTU domain-containing protein 3 [Chrysochloris asiatica]|uniref:OTU domain-containing protein 3 n=1 Tax=Chrysochloris asiatica TaxID=185453 RepID=A0A9B0WNW6_CHRAS|nr:PREDICTED: OTU domain-containing protein 3 [Chrysochloris asiatica]
MSRKQVAKSRPGSGSRKAEAERKRDERAARRALAKERRNRPEPSGGGSCEEEFLSFANQLQALGLKLREVPGDGSARACLLRLRQLENLYLRTVSQSAPQARFGLTYRWTLSGMVASLAKPGTFAGNDAIVAFARNHQLNVVIHQLNAPLWQIRGTDKSNERELHIAYRYGEHYDSVRRINDNSEAPAHLQTDFQMLHQDESNKREKIKAKGLDFEDDLRDEVEDAVQKVCNATGCSDFNLIVQNLEAENYNIESAIIAMLQMNQGKRNNADEHLESSGRVLKPCGPLWEESGSGARIFGNQGLNEGRIENNKARVSPTEENKANKNQLPKTTNKQRREQQRLEKKRRQEERHRQKALESRSSHRDNRSDTDVNTQVTLVKTFAALNI